VRRQFGRIGGSRAVMACALGLGFALTGCMVGPKYKVPSAPIAERWRAAQDARISGDPADPKEWWKVFNDPVLDSLIQTAHKQNLTLQIAALRIVQARLRNSLVWLMELSPIPVGPSASYMHSKHSTTVKPDVSVTWPNPPPPLAGILKSQLPQISVSPEIDKYSGDISILWKPDIWGGTRRRIQATAAMVAAEFASYDDALVALVAEVASTYVRIRAYDEQLGVLRENIALQEKLLKGAQDRFGKNQASEADVHLATVLLRDTQAKVPLVEMALHEAENALCVLLGKAPGDIRTELGAARPIPIAPAKVAVGVPADLLRRRPDVRRAEREAAAACAQIGIARAKLYPSLDLFAMFGVASSFTGQLFDSASHTSAYGGSVSWNPLLYPATIEMIRDADAQYQGKILAYQESVLQAAREAEDAAARFTKAHDRLQALTDGVAASKRAAEVSTAKYQDGSVAFPMPLESLRYLESEQSQMIEARGSVALNLIALYKALGGGWEIRQGQDLLSDENRQQMRSRTDWKTFLGPRDLKTKEK